MKFLKPKITLLGLIVFSFFLMPAPAEAQMIRTGLIARHPYYFNLSMSNFELRMRDDLSDFSTLGRQFTAGHNLSDKVSLEGRIGLYDDDSNTYYDGNDNLTITGDVDYFYAAYIRYNFGRDVSRRIFEDPPEALSAYGLAGLSHYKVEWSGFSADGEDPQIHENFTISLGLGGSWNFTERLNGNFEIMGHLETEDDIKFEEVQDESYYATHFNLGLTLRL